MSVHDFLDVFVMFLREIDDRQYSPQQRAGILQDVISNLKDVLNRADGAGAGVGGMGMGYDPYGVSICVVVFFCFVCGDLILELELELELELLK